MFGEESLGKIKFRAFPKPVDELYRFKALITLEQVNTKWSEKKRSLISKTAMVRRCKLSLDANGSCDEHAVYFRRKMTRNDVPCKSLF